ncbi:CatB-related O-acetyltransferase [Nocardioides humilatus]|uniref:CatB-related O-acetyltransferase n=1 Tax=Nocardioides humilatus TaxID=2607660 RepID=UPI00165FD167|nr:CatB-related O-acetyltransferase [Nocardioides humilatus]
MVQRFPGPELRASIRRIPTSIRQRRQWYKDDVEVVRTARVSRNAVLGRRVRINGFGAHIDPCTIGPYTLVGRVVIRAANHHTEFLNLQELTQQHVIGGRSVLKPPSAPVTIGAGCWIADNVVILEGVTIGNGVIVGAGAVVTKSIPDYAIAIGTPAKVVKYRYPEEVIELIKDIDWWNWSDAKLRANVELFNVDLSTVDPAELKELLGRLH